MTLDTIRTASIEELDPFAADLIRWEDQQQASKLILIPSVSAAPRAVLQALGSSFQNVCAEGLPAARMMVGPSASLEDVAWQMASNRRYADRRFYKGVHFVDFAEALAQRRCAEAFAGGSIRPEHLHVNVQALSGGIANLAIYEALMEPGDTLMGMDLYEGGHLSHGSQFNQSGQRYRVVSYAVDPETERLDYDRIQELAHQHRPKVLIAGYTSYPWAPDWARFREIADEVGAYMLADIAHTAGLVLGGVIENPIEYADVVSLTTNKTLLGPRSAAVMTTDKDLARRIDHAVFPGTQGAPHPNKFVAVAVAFEIAKSDAFRQVQQQIAANARAFAAGLARRGIRLAYGGTDTHLFVIDLKSLPSPTGYPLYGEPASRILELAGVVVNKNSVPGDQMTSQATGLRMGTPWLSQRGLVEADMDELAGLIHRLLSNIHPFSYNGNSGLLPRGKVALEVLEEVREGITGLVAKTNDAPGALGEPVSLEKARPDGRSAVFRISGERSRPFLQQLVTANIAGIKPGEQRSAFMLDRNGIAISSAIVRRAISSSPNSDCYLVAVPTETAEDVFSWMWAISDGYALFDEADVFRKIEGPVVIEALDEAASFSELPPNMAGIPGSDLLAAHPQDFDLSKPYFAGQQQLETPDAGSSRSEWAFTSPEIGLLKKTPLHAAHLELGARMIPFAGWDMPLRYDSVAAEHKAVREGAGLFDVAHMGVLEVSGPHATAFLDVVFSNYAGWLEDMQACYGYLLNPAGRVIDDAIVYRLERERYLMVVNAANEDKAWDWLNQVNAGQVILDTRREHIKIEAPAVLRDLKSPVAGQDQKRDLALQGPASLPALMALIQDPDIRFQLSQLGRNNILACDLAGIPVLVARTGYTGEEWGFEIFVHPDRLPGLWEQILAAGEPLGVRPAGLGARDSVRIEAGLPLYGQELSGPYDLSPVEAAFPAFVKYHKPFFVGRDALLAREDGRRREVVRFAVTARRSRRPQLGDPILDEDGSEVGNVTSCSIGEDRRFVGQAVVERKFTKKGTDLGLLILSGTPRPELEAAGPKLPAPVPIRILDRFLVPRLDRSAE